MVKKKKKSREQFEGDALLTSYARTVGYIQNNRSMVIGAAVALLLVIGGGIFYYVQTQQQEQEAQELLIFAERLFERGQYEEALYGDDVMLTAGFAEIIEDYPRTSAANIARYYAALSALQIGDNYEALQYIERYRPPSGILGVGPLSVHGTILANLGEYEEAARQFKRAADWDRNHTTTPQNLLLAAQASIEAGNRQDAADYLNEVIEEFEGSRFAEEAKSMQGMLTARR